MEAIKICLFLTIVLYCDGYSNWDPLSKNGRRFSLQNEQSVILGAPLYPYHLPEAEPILPGHTLIRPAIGMLKSAVKFPHRDTENGAGVYGHIDNLGIKYDGKNERVMYTGFRRMLSSDSENDIVKRKKPRRRYTSYQNLEDLTKKILLHSNILLPLKDYIENPKIKATDLLNLYRILKSLRRDQNDNTIKGPSIFEVSSFVLPTEVEEEPSMTQQFWNTKDYFNHIKINPEAPELSDLLPLAAYEDLNTWWFYHQNDFQEFQDRI